MSDSKPITPKQESFARHYVANGFNGTQAAISAGYSEDTANEQAARLLVNVSIQNFIKELQKPIVEKAKKGAEDVYQMAANAAFLDVRKVLTVKGKSVVFSVSDFAELPEEIAILIQSIEERVTQFGTTVKVTFVDKLKALEMLARFNGMNKDSVKVTTTYENATDSELVNELKKLREETGEA